MVAPRPYKPSAPDWRRARVRLPPRLPFSTRHIWRNSAPSASDTPDVACNRNVAQSGKRACLGCRRSPVQIRPFRPIYPGRYANGRLFALQAKGWGFESLPPYQFSGCSSAWKSARFGTARPEVQILSPRPSFSPSPSRKGCGLLSRIAPVRARPGSPSESSAAGSAPALGVGCRGFKSRLSDQI